MKTITTITLILSLGFVCNLEAKPIRYSASQGEALSNCYWAKDMECVSSHYQTHRARRWAVQTNQYGSDFDQAIKEFKAMEDYDKSMHVAGRY